jgi:GntR family transcriptional regulator
VINEPHPTPEEIATSAVLPGAPVVELLHTGLVQEGQPFEVTGLVMSGDRSGRDDNISLEEPE